MLAQHFDHTAIWKKTRGKAFFSGGCGFSRHKIIKRATCREGDKHSKYLWDALINPAQALEVGPPVCSGTQKSLWRQQWEIFGGKEVPVTRKELALGTGLRNMLRGGDRCLGVKLACFFFFSPEVSYLDIQLDNKSRWLNSVMCPMELSTL